MADPPSTASANHCPTCGYDLTGLAAGASLVSCPECGALVRPGAPRHVPSSQVNSRLVALMIAPMLAVTAVCWLLSLLVPDAARGPLYLPLIWAGSLIVPGAGVAFLWPGAVALVITDPARTLPRPWPSVLALLALATGINGAALWIAGRILHVSPAFS